MVILALPNGASGAFVKALDTDAPGTIVIDLSADPRFHGPRGRGGLRPRCRGPHVSLLC